MDPEHRKTLDRITAESITVRNAARESCVDGAKHIADSRAAIARSLRLLGKRHHQLDE